MQHDAGRTGAGECGGDFLADVARFADSDHDDFAALAERADNQVHRAIPDLRREPAIAEVVDWCESGEAMQLGSAPGSPLRFAGIVDPENWTTG